MRGLSHAGLSTVLLERECLAVGLSTWRTSEQTFIASAADGQGISFNKSGTVLNSRPAGPLTTNKHSTRLLLQGAGVPVPRGRRFDQSNIAAATAYAEELGYPVVLKPLHGAQGHGVVTGISSTEDLEWAFQDVASSTYAHDDILVEEQIDGEAYRIIVVGDRAVSALISRRGAITGDGRHTVRQLVEQRQELRTQNPHLMSRPISIDERMRHLLERQDITLGTVLTEGRVVEFTYGSNTQMGGEPAQVLPEVHPSILEASVSAVQALPGLGFGGVDFLVPDISQPLSQQRAGICEVNSLPAIDSHEYPLYGAAMPVARDMVAASAQHNGLALGEHRDSVNLKVTIDAPTATWRYRRWLRTRARKMRLRCRLRTDDQGRLAAEVLGDAGHAAVWLALIQDNRHRIPVREVETVHA
ncbi:ATP-grasp domain-containing protein [Garicola koreensis]|uniref:D-alanine-D-alanine ligase-like ATP-grasp enzyme n=1 Tax=Garicola koreensis TaxID=1262554 RepID=A0A7W5Y0G5_9MICC|nr:ATP-grasp domain-containing protein [Garicola koreensis]MBB3667223.1 D-alanine-D-alanine ligase-like ATP-grasp enzyme [Garicola koreensis]